MSTNCVSFFCNTDMLPGLHATLASMIEHLRLENEERLDVIIHLDGVSWHERQLVWRTLDHDIPFLKVEIREYTPVAPQGANGLNGNFTIYGRIHLASLLPDRSHCVYLDSDLIITTDIRDLCELSKETKSIGGSGIVPRNRSVDRELYSKAGLDMDGFSFNAGVLLINLDYWRENSIDARIEEVAREYAGKSNITDQNLLNIVFAKYFVVMESKWNMFVFPYTSRLREIEEGVYHCVGDPKPWDIFGNRLNRNFVFWNASFQRSACAAVGTRHYVSIKRIPYIAGALCSALLERILGWRR